ncbi:MAG: helix-turn-helix domain-containing protein [Alphaproteobacteria bacterium]|nr:helix-turn-helix domain-containing protein [Alphaproteobacteria bacterium]
MLYAQEERRPEQFVRSPRTALQIEVAEGLVVPGFKMNFARDEEIYGAGEEADFVYKVISGVVRAHLILDDGRRQISAFLFPGDVFGLEPGDTHTASAEAVTECEIGLAKANTLRRAAAEDSMAALGLWDLTSRELLRVREHLMLLGRKSAAERVASFLLELTARSKDGKVSIPMSRLDIADYLGLTIETVSRTLSKLERDGTIALPTSRQIILTNRAAMSEAHA